MDDPAAWILVGLAALAAFGAVAFQSPVRAAASFLVCLLFAGSLLLAFAQPALAGLLLWVSGGGAGLVVLGTVLLLNLSAEEAGARRFSLSRVLALFLVAWFGAALVGITSAAGALAEGAARGTAVLDGAALGRALYGEHGLALAVSFLGLCAVAIASLVMARRRA